MYLQVKKDTKHLTRKINQLIACTNATIERGRGGKRFLPQTKDIGTREGDFSGKGKYFPASTLAGGEHHFAPACAAIQLQPIHQRVLLHGHFIMSAAQLLFSEVQL